MYATEEERMKALRASIHKYQKNKEWYCDICCNGKNYTARGKHSHLNTKKHKKNALSFCNDNLTSKATQLVDDLIIF